MTDYFEMSEGMGPCILGIDPGMKGGLGFYFPAIGRVAMEDIPLAGKEVHAPALVTRINQFPPRNVRLGKCSRDEGPRGVFQGNVRLGKCSFNFGMSFGQIRGVICAMQIPLYLVSPQKWKKFYQLDSDKEKSRAKAIQLFPLNADRLTLKKHEGRAEAALLAKFGAENYWNGRFTQSERSAA
jgi:hypothetical protein